MTVRRDLDVLARHNLIEKVHGGATVASAPSIDEPGFVAKSSRELSEKEAIALAAARLVRPGTAIALSGGTTTLALAQRIVHVRDLTIVTNSSPGRRRPATGARRADRDPHRWDPHAVRRARRSRRRPGDPVAALRHPLPRLPRHGSARGAHHAQPRRVRDQPGVHSRRSSGGAHSPTTRSGARSGLSSFADLDEVDVLITDPGLSDDARSHGVRAHRPRHRRRHRA